MQITITTPAYALDLPEQVITGNPLGNTQLASPTTVLEADALTVAGATDGRQHKKVTEPGSAI